MFSWTAFSDCNMLPAERSRIAIHELLVYKQRKFRISFTSPDQRQLAIKTSENGLLLTYTDNMLNNFQKQIFIGFYILYLQKEQEEALKLLRKSLTIKATPMPSFYHEAPSPKAEYKKVIKYLHEPINL